MVEVQSHQRANCSAPFEVELGQLTAIAGALAALLG
jgi:hypothetical protein